MTSKPPSTTEPAPTVHRTLRVRLYPGDAETGNRLAGMAGACRFVYNRLQLQAVRQHWRIENAPLGHGCRLWDDRRIRTGYAAHNRAILKRIANKRLAAAWNKDYLCPLSGLKPKPV